MDLESPVSRAPEAGSVPAVIGQVINGGHSERSRIFSITLIFSEDVGASLAADDLVLRNLTDKTQVSGANLSLQYDASTHQGTWTFPGFRTKSLPPGNYLLELNGAKVLSSAGVPLAASYYSDLFVLPGDANGDRTVNDLDLYQVWQNELKGPGQKNANEDLNGDGIVDRNDVAVVAANYLTTLPALPFQVVSTSPSIGALDVGSTVRPQLFFSRPVDAASLNDQNFYATLSGQKLAATIVPADSGLFAWLFFKEPMPGSAQVQVTADGSSIRALGSGQALDADNDGSAGGTFQFSFSTVSLAPVAGTSLSGVVADPGPDGKPYTEDDAKPGPDGKLGTADDIYLNPIAGVKVFILGRENDVVTTGADGRFHFDSVPTGNVKIAFNGRTSTTAPAGMYFPELVMDATMEVGKDNAVMAASPAVYLPRLASDILQTVQAGAQTNLVAQPEGATGLTDAQRQQLRIEVEPNSLVAADGTHTSSAQIGISTVPPEIVRDMLPAGVLQHTFDITVQALGMTNFSTPAPMTFPNVFNAAPGSKLNFLSFDHTTGRLVIEGTATVSADGLSVHTDPGTGVTHPGWHGLTPPGGCGGSGGAPPPPPPPPPADTRTEIGPLALPMISSEAGTFPTLVWKAPDKPDKPAPLPPPANCAPPPHPPPDPKDPSTTVIIDVDGPLAQFMKKTGDLDLVSQSFTLSAGSGETKTFGGTARTYDEIFGPNGFVNLSRDQLYGSKVKVTEIDHLSDGSTKTTVTTYLLYRWIDVVDPVAAAAHSGNTAAFFKTLADGTGNFVRTKQVDLKLPSSVVTSFDGKTLEFNFPGAFIGGGQAEWTFDPVPENIGNLRTDVVIKADEQGVGVLTARGTAIAPTRINVNLAGYKDELKRVITNLKLAWTPGADGAPGKRDVDSNHDGVMNDNHEYGALGSDDRFEVVYDYGGAVTNVWLPGADGRAGKAGVDDDGNGVIDDPSEFGAAGSDDENRPVLDYVIGGAWGQKPDGNFFPKFVIVSDRFKQEFSGFMPQDRKDPGPDGRLGTNDDLFTADQLKALDQLLNTKAAELKAAVQADYDPINANGAAYTFVDDGGDVTMGWRDLFSAATGAPIYGRADFDADVATLKNVLPNNNLPLVSKEYALVQALNQKVANSGNFAVAINASWSSAATFAQFVANTVSHEVGHTFGLKDAYWNNAIVPPNTAGCDNAGNCTPFDIMRSGSNSDPDLTFLPQNSVLLQAAMGIFNNNFNILRGAVQQYRDTINLPASTNGIRENEPTVVFGQTIVTPPSGAELIVQRGGAGFFGAGASDDLGSVSADGPGGKAITANYTVTNNGYDPLTISSVTLANGATGFSVTSTGLANTPIAPGQSATLTVQFDPSAAGLAQNVLDIKSNSGVTPDFQLALTATGIQKDPAATLAIIDNNLGGLALGAAPAQKTAIATVQNDGADPLLITAIELVEGSGTFQLLHVPADLASSPITLQNGQSYSLGASFSPDKLGLRRGIIVISTNDPAHATLRLAVDGTGLPSIVYPRWGNDFVAIDTPELAGSTTLRTRSDDEGHFSFFLPPQQFYRMTIFDPETGLVSHSSGFTPASGGTIDLTVSLVFGASTEADHDGDGLPDDIEHALGTSTVKRDTDGDGIDDFTAVQLGLNPLGGRAFPTGVVANLPLSGQANEIVVAGSAANPGEQLAYLATGSSGLAIVDVSDFKKPILLSELALPGTATDVSVDPFLKIAAVADNQGGTALVDVSDPAAPKVLRTLSLAASNQVEVADGIAYVTVGGTLQKYDLLTGEQLQVLPMSNGTLTGLAREGGMVYTMDSADTLRAADISSSLMVARGSLVMPQGGGKVFVGNGVAYVAASDFFRGGFATADVSNPAQLKLLAGSQVDSTSSAPATFFVPNGSGIGLLIGTPTRTNVVRHVVDVMNIADPAKTNLFLTRFDLPEDPASVALASGIGFVADGRAGLQVVNYLSFDTGETAPSIQLDATKLDQDSVKAGIQVVEGTTVPVPVNVSDDVQVRNVELLVNGRVIENAVSYPYNLSFAAPAISSTGSNLSIQVRATDTGGNTAVSGVIAAELVRDTVPPRIISQDPADGSVRGQNFRTVHIDFSKPMNGDTINGATFELLDASGATVPAVQFQMRSNSQSLQITYGTLALGDYQLIIHAPAVTDRAGNALGSALLKSKFTITKGSIIWVNDAGGAWDIASNWDKGVVPGPADDVFIGVAPGAVITLRSGSVTVNSLRSENPVSITGGTLSITAQADFNSSLSLAGGTLSGAGTINFNKELDWANGTISGAGLRNISVTALANLTTGSSKFLDSGTLSNGGRVVWTGEGNLYLQNGASFVNSGVFDAQNNQAVSYNGGAAVSFTNTGTFIKSAGTGTTRFDVALNNRGVIRAASGTIQVNAGGVSNGQFDAAAAGTILFSSGTQTLLNVQFTGSGFSRVTGGSVNANGVVTAAKLGLDGGALGGVGAMTVTELLDWTGGAISGTGAKVITAAATCTIHSGNSKFIDASTFTNSGTTVFSDTGNLYLQSAAVFANAGTFDARTDQLIGYNGGAAVSFINTGTFIKSAGTGATRFDIVLLNNGVVTAASGTLQINGGGTTSGNFNVTKGTLLFSNGTSTLAAGATFTGDGISRVIGGTVVLSGDVSIQNISLESGSLKVGASLTVTGTLAWTGGSIGGTGTVQLSGTGILNLSSNNSKFLDGVTFNNVGKTLWTGTGNLYLQNKATFLNAGTFDMQNDQLVGYNGGAAPLFVNNGVVVKSAGVGTSRFDVTLNNAGTLTISSGTVQINAASTSTGKYDTTNGILLFTNSTSVLAAGATLVGSGVVRLTGGTLNVAGDISIQTLAFEGGNLSVTGTLTLPGTMAWTGGTLNGSGITKVSATGVLTASSSNSKFVDGTKLNNNGKIVWTGTGNIYLQSGAVLNNAGTLDAQNDQLLGYNGGSLPSFNNTGTVLKSAGTGATRFDVAMNNDGAIRSQSGTIQLNAGGSSGGTFDSAPGAILFSNGTSNLGNAIFTGPGGMRITGGTFNANGTVSAVSVALDGGTLSGTGTLTISGLLDWTGGTISGTGSKTVAAGASFNLRGTSSKFLDAATLNNFGTAVFSGTGNLYLQNKATFANGGTFDMQNDQQIGYNGGSAPSFMNSGTLLKSSGTGISRVDVALTNRGTIDIKTGTVNFNGSLTQTDGLTRLGGGNLSGTTLTLQGGVLSGAGTITGNVVNSAVISPGGASAIGTLQITGTYQQTAAGVLNLELSGTTSDLFDRLLVSGAATLNGTVSVGFLNGFVPASGSIFKVITFASKTGDFSSKLGLAQGGIILTAVYDSTSLTLKAG